MCWCVSVCSAAVSTTGFTLHENVCQIALQSQEVDAVYFPWNEAKTMWFAKTAILIAQSQTTKHLTKHGFTFSLKCMKMLMGQISQETALISNRI